MGIWWESQNKHTISMISRGFRLVSEHISELIGDRQPFAFWLTDRGIFPPRRYDWRLVAIAKQGSKLLTSSKAIRIAIDFIRSIIYKGWSSWVRLGDSKRHAGNTFLLIQDLSYLPIVLTIL